MCVCVCVCVYICVCVPDGDIWQGVEGMMGGEEVEN